MGVVAGIVSFVRVLNWLFKHYHDLTVALLTGIVMGSLRKIWPWKEIISFITTSHGKVIPIEEVNVWPAHINAEVGLAVAIMVIGFILALKLNAASGRKLISS
jgi:putative membrane protein